MPPWNFIRVDFVRSLEFVTWVAICHIWAGFVITFMTTHFGQSGNMTKTHLASLAWFTEFIPSKGGWDLCLDSGGV